MNDVLFPPRVWHGVNLGNWLLLEKWIQPSLFALAPGARDEFSLCEALGPGAEAHMRRHRETYVTADDFRFLRDYGINAVRIPLGYWVVDPQPPFVGALDDLDHAVDWCREFGIAAILDLHGAPGHQSPAHHTGRAKHFQWHLSEDHRKHSLDVLETLAQRYKDNPAVEGISVLNEPHREVPSSLLLEFYHAAYQRIRKHLPAERCSVIVEAHPHFRLADFHGKLQTLGCRNVVTDVHFYQAFYDHYNRLEVNEHLALPMSETWVRINEASRAGPLSVGEWSLQIGNGEPKLHELPKSKRDLAHRAFAAMQLAAFEDTAGWFFWTYKTETDPVWSLCECIRRHWMPEHLVAASTRTSDPIPLPAETKWGPPPPRPVPLADP